MALREPGMLPFTYSPLAPGTIRLLVPDPASEPGGHAWNLQTISIDLPDLQFDALSYVWGPETEGYPIILNGRRSSVRRNLYAALPYLTQRGNLKITRPIWIDAICINQGDEEEKRVQIRLMNKIYRQAVKVWAWLGIAEHQEQISKAIALFQPAIELEEYCSKQFVSWNDRMDKTKALGMDGLSPALWSAFLHLTANAWYRRLWIVQEAALAHDFAFLCSGHEVEFEQLELVISSVPDLIGIIDAHNIVVDFTMGLRSLNILPIRKLMGTAREAFGADFRPWNYLLVTAVLVQPQECLLPEDHVFGLLGLLDQRYLDTASMDLVLQSTSIPDLYTRFSLFMLTHGDEEPTGTLWDYIDLAFSLEKNEDLPSWVPDLHQVPSSYLHGYTSVQNYNLRNDDASKYQASSRKITAPRRGSLPYQLVLQGKLIDTVTVVYPEIPEYKTPTSDLDRVEHVIKATKWEQMIAALVLEVEQGNIEGAISLDTYWRTLTGNRPKVHGGPATGDWYQHFRTTYADALKFFGDTNATERLAAGVPLGELGDMDIIFQIGLGTLAYDFYQTLMSLAGRQLFRTKEGKLGFTKRGVQAGDVVCVFNGSPIVHVLRGVSDVDSEKPIWRFVGDAYVHGLMNGEADGMDIEARDIVLE
ncbi:Nn.00g053560.m01.CDS01 [Neocucurbitaria sp. VM-36]